MTQSYLADGQQIAILALEELASEQGLEVIVADFGEPEAHAVPLRISFAGYREACVCPVPTRELAGVDVAAIRLGLRVWLRDRAGEAEKAGQELALALFDEIAEEHGLSVDGRFFGSGIGNVAFPLHVSLSGVDSAEVVRFARSVIRRRDAAEMRALLRRWAFAMGQRSHPASG